MIRNLDSPGKVATLEGVRYGTGASTRSREQDDQEQYDSGAEQDGHAADVGSLQEQLRMETLRNAEWRRKYVEQKEAAAQVSLAGKLSVFQR